MSWRIGERKLLWGRATAHWDRVAPVLFPCVGWSRDGVIRIDGQSYPMPVHGFASASRFRVVESSRVSLTLELRASSKTSRHYPFHFALRVRHTLGPRSLSTRLEVENTGGEPMPYACGLHPGFAWPLARRRQDDYGIVFSEVERPEVPVITGDGLFCAYNRVIPLTDRLLRLDAALFEREALCFLNARSQTIRFSGPGGAIDLHAEGFRHWALWSRPGAPFLCVEAWTGHGDPDGFVGDFREKPSIDLLAPGEIRRHALTMVFQET